MFPSIAPSQRPDLVVWNDIEKKALLLELALPREDNLEQEEDRKAQRYETLIEDCEKQDWEIKFYHFVVGCRGFVDRGISELFRKRFDHGNKKVK